MLSPYAASKAALNILTKNVAYTVMRKRIRVNALALGWMDTPGEATVQQRYHTQYPHWLAKAEASQPFGRLLKPAEVARAIAYLASDESGLMTGSIIDFDQSIGGQACSRSRRRPRNGHRQPVFATNRGSSTHGHHHTHCRA